MQNSKIEDKQVIDIPARRNALLDEYFRMDQGLSEIRDLLDSKTAVLPERRLIKHYNFYTLKLDALESEYLEIVPRLEISQCPFTGEILQHSLDYYGLDGLWWNYFKPLRPSEKVPASFFALTGAVSIKAEVPWTPFLCKPGPEVPYVIPGILNYPSIKAVISSLNIGENPAYVIAYYGYPVPLGMKRVNTWGTDYYHYLDDKGHLRWDASPEKSGDYDFNIEPWIKQGKLYWIAPGDKKLNLKKTTADCPYIGLKGRQSITRIQLGKAW